MITMTKKAKLVGVMVLLAAGMAFMGSKPKVEQGWKTLRNTLSLKDTPILIELKDDPARVNRYRITVKNEGWYNLGAVLGQEADKRHTVRATLSAEMIKTAVDAAGDQQLLQFYDIFAEIFVDDAVEMALIENLKRTLGQGVLIRKADDGRIAQMTFAAGVDQFAREFVYGMLMKTQLVVGNPPRWETHEQDSSGDYIADYECAGCTAGQKELTITKEVRSYEKLKSLGKGLARAAKVRGEPSGKLTAKLDATKGRLTVLEGTETLRLVNAATAEPMAENTQSLTYEWINESDLDATKQTTLKSFVDGTFHDQSDYKTLVEASERQAMDRIYRADLGESSFDDIKAALLDLAQSESADKTKLRREAYAKAKAFVYLNPDNLGSVKDELTELAATTEAFQIWTKALSAVGSPEAQRVIADVLLARVNEKPVFTELIPSLGLVDEPTVHSEETLKQLANVGTRTEQKSMAQLALGIMGFHLKDGDQASQGRFLAMLEDAKKELDQANDSEDKRFQLALLGNAGAKVALPAIKPFLAHSDANLQKEALLAMRLIDDPEVIGIFRNEALAGNELSETAVEALGYQPASVARLAIEADILAANSPTKLKNMVLGNVFQEARALPKEVRQLITRAANQEQDTEVQRYARELLRNLDLSEPKAG